VADGLALIDEALKIAGRSSDMASLSEFSLLKGDLLLAGAAGADPEPWFRWAFDSAEGLGIRMSQLRAAVRLCRLWRERGSTDAGDRVLRTVYDTFTEGFATADLVEARTLLGTVPEGGGDPGAGRAR
jgi:hypothetical protein